MMNIKGWHRLLAIIAVGYWLLTGGGCFAQEPQFDPYGGLVGAVCPVTPTPEFTGVQLTTAGGGTVTTTQAINPGATSFTVNDASKIVQFGASNAGPCGSGGCWPHLDIDPGSTTPISVTGEILGTGTGAQKKFTKTLARASVVQNSLVLLVNSSQVATESYGAIISPTPGQITGHVSTLLNSSQAFLSVTFATAPAAAASITVNYSYLPTEVTQVTNVSSNTITVSPALSNSHNSGATVLFGYFRIAKINTNRWTFCDPLNHPFYQAALEQWQVDGHYPYSYSSSTPGANGQSHGGVAAGDNPENMLVVNTTITGFGASCTSTGTAPQPIICVQDPTGIVDAVSLNGATLGTVASPVTSSSMFLSLGNSSTVSEFVRVSSVSSNQVTLISQTTVDHTVGELVGCCNNKLLNFSKYGDRQSAIPLQMQLFKTFGYNSRNDIGGNGESFPVWTMQDNSEVIWDLPDGGHPFKVPYATITDEYTLSMRNQQGFSPAAIQDYQVGTQARLFNYSWHNLVVATKPRVDTFDPNFYTFTSNLTNWWGENPWRFGMGQDQGDRMPQWGSGDDFATLPTGKAHMHETILVLASPPTLTGARNTAYAPQTHVAAIGKTKNYSKLALKQYLQGLYDPLNFQANDGAAASGNISSISCSGSNVVVAVNNIGAHMMPFTLGQMMTVTGTTNFNNGSTNIANVIQRNSNGVTLKYTTSPCPVATESAGTLGEGPGYATYNALNTSWGSSYDSFDSHATPVTAETPGGCTNGCVTDGSTVTFNGTLAHTNVDPASLLITASNGTVTLPIIAEGVGGTTTGTLTSWEAISLTTSTCTPCTADNDSVLTFTTTLSGSTATNYFQPGMAIKVGSEIVAVKSVAIRQDNAGHPTYAVMMEVAPQTGWTIASITVHFTQSHSTGESVTAPFALSGTPGSITYSTGALTINFASAPPIGWTLKGSYNYGGYAYSNSDAFMDEDGRVSHQSWTGTEAACVHVQLTKCPAGTTTTKGNANWQRDIDGFLQVQAAHYGRIYAEAVHSGQPHMPIMSDYAVGSAGGVAFPAVLAGMSPFVDFVFTDANINALYNAAWTFSLTGNPNCAAYPPHPQPNGPSGVCFPQDVSQRQCSASSTCYQLPAIRTDLPNVDPRNLDRYNFMAYYWGDKPITYNYFISANRQSGGAGLTSTLEDTVDLTSQLDRGRWYAERVEASLLLSVNGTYQLVGFADNQPDDMPACGNRGYCNYGKVTPADNLYDGIHDTTNPPPLVVAGYPIISIPEDGNWGDMLSPLQAAIWGVENAWINGSVGSVTSITGKAGLGGARVH